MFSDLLSKSFETFSNLEKINELSKKKKLFVVKYGTKLQRDNFPSYNYLISYGNLIVCIIKNRI